jgi:hypothetical protein
VEVAGGVVSGVGKTRKVEVSDAGDEDESAGRGVTGVDELGGTITGYNGAGAGVEDDGTDSGAVVGVGNGGTVSGAVAGAEEEGIGSGSVLEGGIVAGAAGFWIEFSGAGRSSWGGLGISSGTAVGPDCGAPKLLELSACGRQRICQPPPRAR